MRPASAQIFLASFATGSTPCATHCAAQLNWNNNVRLPQADD